MVHADSSIPIVGVLLAGGAGTRLWPVSRELFPKQLVNFFGNKSLIQHTALRLSPVISAEHIHVVCGSEHYFEIERHLSNIGISPEDKILSEPCGRNTAPAILLALVHILKRYNDAVVCVFPADHVIKNMQGFHEKLNAAVRLATEGFVVTFGITADYPETGYGYIEGGASISESAFRIRRFVEKPDVEKAKAYIAAGNYFWNSGMFAFKASVMRAEFERHHPDMLAKIEELVHSPQGVTLEKYASLEDLSIDYAIMEKTDKGAVLPSDFGWSDIGSWKSLYDFLPKDGNENVIDGDVICENTTNSFIMGYHRLIATNEVENLVVIDTPDSVFVSNIDTSRNVKTIVTQLKKSGREEYHHHRMVYHHWGTETLLSEDKNFTVYKRMLYAKAFCTISRENGDVGNIMIVDGEVALDSDEHPRRLKVSDTVTISEPDPIILRNTGKGEAQFIYTIIRSKEDEHPDLQRCV